MLTTTFLPASHAHSPDDITYKKNVKRITENNLTKELRTKIDTEVTDYHLNYEVSEFISKYLMNFSLKEVHLFSTRCSDKIILYLNKK